MDRVRFGRALGFGARQAVKTVVSAVDAATAENPSGRKPAATTPSQPLRTASAPQISRPTPDIQPPRRGAAATVTQARDLHQGLKRGGRRFGQAVWNPFVRLSGVLWLEVTGVFFGIMAAFAAQGVWKARAEWHASGSRQHLFMAAVMLALFGYFCISSFVRAHHRSKRR